MAHGGITPEQLRGYVERIEKLEEEKAGLQFDIREVYNEAKASGFDKKVLGKVIQRRRKNDDDVQQEENLLHLYESALKGEGGG